MVAPKKEIKDQVLKDWLTEFNNKNTKQNYVAALRKFKKNLSIEDLDEYLQSNPDAAGDMRKFLISLAGRPSKTIAAYTAAVRVFFTDHNIKLEDNDWRKLRRRGFMPKRVKAETRDKSPTKTQLKKILNYADIKARSMILFLVSSGARIGETLKLKIEDFELDAEPPRVHIRAEYTKGGVGARTAYFSIEARDAINDWLNIKDGLKKRNGKKYIDKRVFGWSVYTARFMWNMACDKAGIGTKDKSTQRRIYHIHSLRKFFRTKIGLDLDVINALMGHSEYLDSSYVRQEQEKIAKDYLEAMPNVSVYAVEDKELKRSVEQLKDENIALKQQLNGQRPEMLQLREELDELRSMLHKIVKQED